MARNLRDRADRRQPIFIVGSGDGVFITTTGVGVIPAGVDIRPDRVAVIMSAALGDAATFRPYHEDSACVIGRVR